MAEIDVSQTENLININVVAEEVVIDHISNDQTDNENIPKDR